MPFQIPRLEQLANESDVEQKLVYPPLTSDVPYGFGIQPSSIQTKANIRKFMIGKGREQKLYFPDYLIVYAGFPIAVIEVKGPGEDASVGFREARLYAAELNAIYPARTNPLTRVLATNGKRWLAGTWDQAEPILELGHADLDPYSPKMDALSKIFGGKSLGEEFLRLSAIVKPVSLWKPRRLLGGVAVQQEEIGHNTFGATIAADFAHIFNPSSREDRSYIVKNGYIRSRRRERYIDPIDRVIRASSPPSQVNAKTLEDTGAPKEIIAALKSPKPLEHQVLLLVGGVGAGKSTFIDYLVDVALPRDLVDASVWVRINMNVAPISSAEIYDFLRNEIISGCRAAYPDVDFDDLKTLQALFSVEVNRFHKGVGQLYASDNRLYKQKLGEVLEKLDADLHQKAVAFGRYCATERQKLLILVLDNCDKRTLDQQLLMFEAANWVQKEFRALVVLPLREETYDNYRDKPPLDTALKDLVFRIEPPLFQNVLATRVQLALNEISKFAPKTYRYELPNGFHVEYAASEQAYYLASIIRAVFEHDRHIRRMIIGLAGRNIRRALEIFLEFCTSGHIGEDQIFKIRQSHGDYLIPLYLVVRVLLRLNRRFYDSDYSYLKSILAIDAKDARGNYFSRILILRWLLNKFSQSGPTGLKGYFPVRQLKLEFTPYGLDAGIIERDLEYLAKAQCIVSEDFRVEAITDEDLVRLAPAGFVHLELLGNVDYVAAMAEDTWFEDRPTAERVAERIGSSEKQYQPDTSIANARELIGFLQTVRQKEGASAKLVVEQSAFDRLTDLSEAEGGITRLERSLTAKPWADIAERLKPGSKANGVVVNVRDFGVFVELEPGVSGLIHWSKLPKDFQTHDDLSIGERVEVEVLGVEPLRQRMGLAYIGPVAE